MTTPPTRFRLEPLGDRVAVLPIDDAVKMTATGIHIPDSAQEAPSTGEVLAVGPGRATISEGFPNLIPVRVNVGDRVVYAKFSGTPFTIDGVTVMLLEERELLAVVRGAPPAPSPIAAP